MNSDRRHELQQNELAGALDRINKVIDPYSKPIAIGVAVLFVAIIAWTLIASRQSDNRSDATLQLIEASGTGNTEGLATIAAQYPSTSAAAWARLYQGSQKMTAGIGAIFNSRDEAEALLGEASEAYGEAMTMSDDMVIRSRAHFGLARVAETLGDVDAAIASYEDVIAVGESPEMIEEAKQRIALLSSEEGKQFLTWFEQQNFAPVDPSMPPSLPGLGELPDLPDLELPDLGLGDDAPADSITDAVSGEDAESMDLDLGLELPDPDETETETEDSEAETTSP